ncbi:MAG: bifunctional proline dehydrogenase/L-glutamate gamma-semialdehyde dehydrogenase PutA, partial [Hyphomicrobiales bacterium]|nr:bifunctional proline dehydrogenase/L-glutamate gamma-semialdehyde dehydrogenase PutA [Hyphomicrobiales bacterium]
QVIADVLGDSPTAGWNGLGLAVQAYGKRAAPVIDWLAALASATGRRIPVRLVKGAYWDAEIKQAQEHGLSGYPVFTRKANTDISYLACMQKLLARPEAFYPQFATHNARTIAGVIASSRDDQSFEFQRLHGMGQALYEEVIGAHRLNRSARIYAPVGGHEELLAYLARRLLENGSNTSFVNRLADDEAPIDDIIADPVARMAVLADKSHPQIPLPANLFGAERENSGGLLLWDQAERHILHERMQAVLAEPAAAGAIIAGEPVLHEEARPVLSPHDNRVRVGTCALTREADIDQALTRTSVAWRDWDRRGGEARAQILVRGAELIEENAADLMAFIVREAGKTLGSAHGEVREAADFLRYYASLARAEFAAPEELTGPTGEHNLLSLHGRGVFACISPWNFPLAIFTGQISAALAAGNAVVAKPAEQTPLTAYLTTRLLHKAGVPRDVLHLLPGAGETVGAALTRDVRVAGVSFTGSNDTANAINRTLAGRSGPITPFIAETGGINAMIVDSSALPEQVVRDAMRSAFDSAGQRCSALRVLFLQDDIADRLITMLLGAMDELIIGDPMDYASDVGPVIDAGAKAALEAHKTKMRRTGNELRELDLPSSCKHGTYVAPAAYEMSSIDVLEEEVFGPILHVVRFAGDRLEQVCESINATGFGLTLGIHSRISSTIDLVAGTVRAGNIYVNRDQIGAVVGVQPFGGEGLSGTGPKAGGPHTLLRYAVERSRTTDLTAGGGNAALLSLEPNAPD